MFAEHAAGRLFSVVSVPVIISMVTHLWVNHPVSLFRRSGFLFSYIFSSRSLS